MLSPLAAPIGKDGMVTLAHFIMWFLLAWLAALAAVVLLRSRGQGRLRELLHLDAPRAVGARSYAEPKFEGNRSNEHGYTVSEAKAL